MWLTGHSGVCCHPSTQQAEVGGLGAWATEPLESSCESLWAQRWLSVQMFPSKPDDPGLIPQYLPTYMVDGQTDTASYLLTFNMSVCTTPQKMHYYYYFFFRFTYLMCMDLCLSATMYVPGALEARRGQ